MLKRTTTEHSRIFEFTTWRDFIEHTRPYKTRVPGWADSRHAGANAETADTMADVGWLEGAEIARKFQTQQLEALGSLIERHDVEYDVEGHSIDVARYLDGEPECWMRFEPVLTPSQSPRFVRIVVNIGASGSVSAETILARGGALCALVDLLELAGVRCEVTVVDAVKKDTHWYCQSVIVKQFDQPLDLPLVAYAIGHPSVLRVHTFRLYERMGDEDSLVWRSVGYGMPADVPEEQRGDIYIGRMLGSDAQWRDPESAQRWVREQLRVYGVALSDETRTWEVNNPA